MAEQVRERRATAARPESAERPALAPPARYAWAGAALALLALARWLTTLAAPWLALAAAGALAWTVHALRRPLGWKAVAALTLWLALGAAAAGQYRLHEVAVRWDTLQRGVEDRSAMALRDALDDLYDRGLRAVSSAAPDAARLAPRGDATAFAQLERIVAAERVSALALYDGDGLPLAWAGEHRGTIPEPVRRGERAASFSDAPLFQYVYFTRQLDGGRTAVAAVLLQSSVDPGPHRPFAERFAARYGVHPRFWAPDRARGDALWDWTAADGPILSVSFAALTQQRWWERVAGQVRGSVGIAWLAAWLALVVIYYRTRAGPPALPVALTTLAALLLPVGRLTGAETLFSPMRFLLPGPLDATLGDTLLLLVGAAVWMLALGGVRWRRPASGWLPPLLAAPLFPLTLVLLDTAAAPGLLARAAGGGFALQLVGILALALPLYLLLRLADGAMPRRDVRLAWLGLLLAAGFGALLVVLWSPARPIPAWVALAWTLPFALVALGRVAWQGALGMLTSWLAVGALAGTLVLPTLWNQHLAVQVDLGEDELARLGAAPDPYLDFLLRQFAEAAHGLAADGERGVNLLYRSWVASGLAQEGEEARLSLWRDGALDAELRLSDVPLPTAVLDEVLPLATAGEAPILRRYDRIEALHYLLLAPLPDRSVVSVVVPPRRHLGRATALGRFLDPGAAPTEADDQRTLTLVPVLPEELAAHVHVEPIWQRTAEGWRSETDVVYPTGPAHAHLLIRVPTLPLLATRGAIVLAAALAVLALIWALARALHGPLGLPRAVVSPFRSFRGRLTFALFAFFLLPTLAFGVVAYGAVTREVVRTAEALARRSLQDAVSALAADPVARLHPRLGRDLVLYRQGVLVDAVAPEVLDLGLFQTWLPADVVLAFRGGEHAEARELRRVGGSSYLVAYRRLSADEVIGAPIALASGEIARRQREFTDVVVLVLLLGGALSVGLSLGVGRALARPIDRLSRAAAAVGGGNLRVRLPEQQPDEFGGLYRSFNRMVHRLRRTRAALLRETRRTELIVAEAATGVLALDASRCVALVNPRAQEILGAELQPGQPLPRANELLAAVADRVRSFWRGAEIERGDELEVGGRVIRLRLRRLPAAEGVAGGAVLALEDITPEIRSARVLAWGEMARQVAHEIKNPLTPIKLSVQHLRRAYADRRPDYERILENNVDSVLREIDRLGEIARAFARFGTPAPADGGQPERVDVGAVVHETLALYRGAEDGIRYDATIEPDTPPALARAGELKEVLVNLLENARDALDGGGGRIAISIAPAGAGAWVAIDVSDTGEGIEEELLPRIFDPQFSTRSSGTGLGLAIVRRLVESWGGEVAAESQPGQGTTVHLRLRSAG